MKATKKRHAWRALFLFCIFFLVIVILSAVGFSLYKQTGSSGEITATSSSTTQLIPATTTITTAPSTSISISPITTPVPVTTPVSVPPPIIYPSSTLSYKFGMSVGQTLLGLDSADLNTRLNDIASLGIGWIRFDIQWDYVQPNGSNMFNWGSIDQLVAAANAHHIKILAILDYTPPWARSSNCNGWSDKCLPANPAQFATFAKIAATRYTPEGISDWEIWNEPNLPGSLPPDGSASAYAELLKDTYIAIKTVNPSAGVISGGLGPADTGNGALSPIDFLTQLYADGDKNYFDAAGFHPYSSPAMPSFYATWNAWSQMSSTTPSLRSIMIANGNANKQIWITEYGAPTGGPGILESSTKDITFAGHPDHVTEAIQAAMISQAITLVQQYSWAGPLFIYSYQDLGTSTSTIENFFGIIRNDGTTKPAYQAIKTLLM